MATIKQKMADPHGWLRIKKYSGDETVIEWDLCPVCGLTRRIQYYVSDMDVNRTENDSP